tara:strand:+ start:899 stop:1312 length:414 start_codon:yes stop_codon:yes gene_type:complete
MIVGLGVDIVEVRRIENVYKKFGIKFLYKLLSNKEINRILSVDSYKLLIQKIASRFAAKEAVIKSFSTVIKKPRFSDFEIFRHESGSPFVKFKKKFEDKNKDFLIDNHQINISLSHENNYAIAFVTLSKIFYEKKKK